MSDNQAKKRSDKLAKVFLIMPPVFFALGLICLFGGMVLERPILRTIMVLGSFAFFGLDILPGAVFSIVGMIRAAKAKMTGFFILGIIETCVALLFTFIVWFIVFVAGPGV